MDKDFEKNVIKVMDKYLRGSGFTQEKYTDTPGDAYAVTPRKYVTLNGPSSSRPTSSVIGQHYFDTTLASGRGQLIVWNGTGFVDGSGTYV